MKRKIIESVLIICLGGMLLGSAMQSNKVEVAEEQIEISTEQEANIETEQEIETEQVATEIVIAETETESEEEVVAVEEPVVPVETNENVEPSESTTTNADREPQRYEDITVEYLNSRLPCEYPKIYNDVEYENWKNNIVTTVGNTAVPYACVHIRGKHHFIPASELKAAGEYRTYVEENIFTNVYYQESKGYVVCAQPAKK